MKLLFWGVAVFAAAGATARWYLPYLRKHIEPSEGGAGAAIFTGRPLLLALLISVLLACLCGYRTAGTVDNAGMLKLLLGLCVLNVAAMTDIELMRIPNTLVLILPLARILFLASEILTEDAQTISGLISSVAGAVFCLVALLLVSVLSRGGLGLGDVKVMTALGFLLGFYTALYTLIFSCFASTAAAVLLLLTKKKTMKDAIPMGPFLYAGYVIVLLLGVYQ